MASKKQCPDVQDRAKPGLELMPLPRSSRDLAMYLQYAACLGFADTKMVAHLTEMSELFPQGDAGGLPGLPRQAGQR